MTGNADGDVPDWAAGDNGAGEGAGAPDWEALGVPPSELLGDELLDELAPLSGPVRWGPLATDELSWLSIAIIEPFDLDLVDRVGHSAHRWWDSVGDRLVTAALQHLALDYEVTLKSWGVVFEVGFGTEQLADAFRNGEAMRSAIDQLGPLRLEVTSGRGGGTSSARVPRRGRPLFGSGAAALPLPEPDPDPAPFEPLFASCS